MQPACDTESLVCCKNQLFLIQHVLTDIVFSTFLGGGVVLEKDSSLLHRVIVFVANFWLQ